MAVGPMLPVHVVIEYRGRHQLGGHPFRIEQPGNTNQIPTDPGATEVVTNAELLVHGVGDVELMEIVADLAAPFDPSLGVGQRERKLGPDA